MEFRVTGNLRNRLGGLFLLGGLLLGNSSMLKAADKFVDVQQDAVQCYNIFEGEVKKEVKERKRNPKDIRDIYFLGFWESLDSDDPEMKEETEELMSDILSDALSNSLDQYAWYATIRENIKERFLGPPGSPARNVYERVGEPKRTFIGKKTLETGLNIGYSHGLKLEAEACLENFRLLGMKFQGAEIGAGNKGMRACLEKTIKDDIYDIYARLGFKLENFSGLDINALLALGNENSGLNFQAGYRDNEDGEGSYAELVFVKRF